MNQSECLDFLTRHQPMPADDDWDAECEALDEVVRFLTEHPGIEALPLLLTVFGPGDGYGVYQTIEVAVMQYRAEDVVPRLLENLGSPARDIVYWNAQIAANFPDERLIAPLSILVRSADEDIQAASLIAVGQIKSPRVLTLLEALSRSPLTDEIRELVGNLIDDQRQDNAD